jgi:hypothetical protein
MSTNTFNWKFVRRIDRVVAILGKNESRKELYVLDLKKKTPLIIDVTGDVNKIRVEEGNTYRITFDIYSAQVSKKLAQEMGKKNDEDIKQALKQLKILKNQVYRFVLVDIRSRYYEYLKSKSEIYLDRLEKNLSSKDLPK